MINNKESKGTTRSTKNISVAMTKKTVKTEPMKKTGKSSTSKKMAAKSSVDKRGKIKKPTTTTKKTDIKEENTLSLKEMFAQQCRQMTKLTREIKENADTDANGRLLNNEVYSFMENLVNFGLAEMGKCMKPKHKEKYHYLRYSIHDECFIVQTSDWIGSHMDKARLVSDNVFQDRSVAERKANERNNRLDSL